LEEQTLVLTNQMTILGNGMENFGHKVKILDPRRDHNLAYDIKRDHVVLFGGLTGTGGTGIPAGDTWELRIE
jgi:hypothetical protein